MNRNRRKTAIYLSLASAIMLGSTEVLAQTGNTAYGTNSLISLTTGNFNSGFGINTLENNDTGSRNTAIGNYSLTSNTSGYYNTASGTFSMYYNTTGNYNAASGNYSLSSNTTGTYNTANGNNSLRSNTTGNRNMASGAEALYSNTTGTYNTASGALSLYNSTTGFDNTAVGYSALYSNTTANNNAAVGAWALFRNTTGTFNTALGGSALYNNTTGSSNSAQGIAALYGNTAGNNNTGLGNLAGASNSTGDGNVFIGAGSGLYETGSNKLYIANNPVLPWLYGEVNTTAATSKLGVGTQTVAAGDAITVWNGAHLTTGGVWTDASSRDLKENIETLSLEDANEALAGLSPVRYVYRNSTDEEYVGFVAEDVPDLVATNDRKSLAPMDIVAVLTTVAKNQQMKMAEKDGEIAALRDSLARQEERILQMEMALVEVLRHQTSEDQVSLAN